MRVLYVCLCVRFTSESTGLCQQKCTPGHEKKKCRLQQLEVSQFGEFGDVQNKQLKMEQPVVKSTQLQQQTLWWFHHFTGIHEWMWRIWVQSRCLWPRPEQTSRWRHRETFQRISTTPLLQTCDCCLLQADRPRWSWRNRKDTETRSHKLARPQSRITLPMNTTTPTPPHSTKTNQGNSWGRFCNILIFTTKYFILSNLALWLHGRGHHLWTTYCVCVCVCDLNFWSDQLKMWLQYESLPLDVTKSYTVYH